MISGIGSTPEAGSPPSLARTVQNDDGARRRRRDEERWWRRATPGRDRPTTAALAARVQRETAERLTSYG